MRTILSGIAVGLVAGILSGLLGVGGGVFLVPALVYIMRMSQHRAHGTSLAAILFIASVGVVSYARADRMDWLVSTELALGGIIGAIFGARLSCRLSAPQLRKYFGFFLIFVAASMIVDTVHELNADGIEGDSSNVLGLWGLVAVLAIGLVTGVLSGLLGVGGGVIMVPAMVLLLGFGQQLAQGISLAVIVPTSISGSIVHYRQGNIRLSDVIWLGVGGAPGALIGAETAVDLNPLLLRGLFNVLLVVLAVIMIRSR